MIHIVLDTNVLIAALRSQKGSSFEIMRLIYANDDRFKINLSVPLVLEYEAVAYRLQDELRLNKRDLDNLIGYLCKVADKHFINYLWRPFLSDPKDDMVLELAVAGNCRYIVTHNVSDFNGSLDFGVEAITPARFLLTLGGEQ